MASIQGLTPIQSRVPKTAAVQILERSSEEIAEHRFARRAVEAAIWGMPIVSVEAMRRAFFSVEAAYGDFCYFSKPADWKFQITTPNASSLYVYFNVNTADGPLVLDLPSADGAGLFGSLMDAWQIPLVDFGPQGEDKGKGAKYVILPPGFKDGVPFGMIPVHSETYNGYCLLRVIPASSSQTDHAKALALLKRLRLHPVAQWTKPPMPKFIDIAGKSFDGIVRMDDTFFDSLAKMVNEEPSQMRDMEALGVLRSIGIEKGMPFKPTAAVRSMLRDAAAEAQGEFMDAARRIVPHWTDSKWGMSSFVMTGAHTGFTFETGGTLDVDARAANYFIACAAPKKLGAASVYLLSTADSEGAMLDGSDTYRLHVPPNVPANQFWAVTVYDLETAGFIRGAPSVEINSYHELLRAPDGSVDVVFGPSVPAGRAANWIYTAPGRQWIACFRFYGPQKALGDKTWRLPDIERSA